MRRVMLAALLLLMPGLAAAQQPVDQRRTVTVTAEGTIEREPEEGVVLFAVESEAEDARAAAEANAERMSRLLAALRGAGVPQRNIRTVSYELRPEYRRQMEPRSDPPQIAGYRAINMVQVTVDTVSGMGRIIDTAIGSGANRVANISFRLRNPHSAHIEAVAIAMRDARREAEAIAEAAGERLGPALSISTGGYRPPQPPMPMYAGRAEMDMAAAQTPVETGTLTVTATVSVVYELAGPR
jgi:uncharacterized protein YggE